LPWLKGSGQFGIGSDERTDGLQHIFQLLDMRKMASLGDDFEATGRDAFGITATIFGRTIPAIRGERRNAISAAIQPSTELPPTMTSVTSNYSSRAR